jgi:hypothetical protein
MKLEDIEPDRVATAVSKAVLEAVGAGGDVDAIVARAIAGARRALGVTSNASSPSHTTDQPQMFSKPAVGGREVVTEADVVDAARAGRTELSVARGALVTPLARDTAKDRGVRLVEA